MLKNRSAMKLCLYFVIALFVFAAVIGVTFISLLRKQTVNLHREQLLERAESISSTLAEFLDGSHENRGMMGFGAYFRFIGDIAGTDVWVVDEEMNLITSGMREGRGQGGHAYEYSDLPQNAETLVKEVFAGKQVIGEAFSGMLDETTLTVGAPIVSGNGAVIGAVLLHSPVTGVNEALRDGIRLLAISIAVALVLAFILSIWLSKHFTDPIIIKEAQDALEMEKTRRDFVANISHELKTPITVIRGSLEALLDEVVTDPHQAADYQRQMLRETIFLQRLVGDLLDLSKLQSTDFHFEKVNISLSELIDDVMRSMRLAAETKGLSISVKSEKSTIELYGDYGRIRQMLLILMDNAVKFSQDGGRIEVELREDELSIRDYGSGIAAEDLPFIFDRFHKSRSERNKHGTGLGLAIAKQIAEQHEMILTAANAENGGAVFILHLPQKT